jgi:hypothetical protein
MIQRLKNWLIVKLGGWTAEDVAGFTMEREVVTHFPTDYSPRFHTRDGVTTMWATNDLVSYEKLPVEPKKRAKKN